MHCWSRIGSISEPGRSHIGAESWVPPTVQSIFFTSAAEWFDWSMGFSVPRGEGAVFPPFLLHLCAKTTQKAKLAFSFLIHFHLPQLSPPSLVESSQNQRTAGVAALSPAASDELDILLTMAILFPPAAAAASEMQTKTSTEDFGVPELEQELRSILGTALPDLTPGVDSLSSPGLNLLSAADSQKQPVSNSTPMLACPSPDCFVAAASGASPCCASPSFQPHVPESAVQMLAMDAGQSFSLLPSRCATPVGLGVSLQDMRREQDDWFDVASPAALLSNGLVNQEWPRLSEDSQQAFPAASLKNTVTVPENFSLVSENLSLEQQQKRRAQVKSACVNCRKACKKCEEQRPCQRCVRLDMADTCVSHVRKPREKGFKRGPYRKKEENSPLEYCMSPVDSVMVVGSGADLHHSFSSTTIKSDFSYKQSPSSPDDSYLGTPPECVIASPTHSGSDSKKIGDVHPSKVPVSHPNHSVGLNLHRVHDLLKPPLVHEMDDLDEPSDNSPCLDSIFAEVLAADVDLDSFMFFDAI